MRHLQMRILKALAICLAVLMGYLHADAEDFQEGLPPYKMIRSLQAVQDSIANGDTGAVDMQRFMLSVIDRSLLNADPSVFDDTRNVDAALIYAMSGGNPATLYTLISRDVAGHFDNRVTDALVQYFNGKGASAKKTLDQTVPEYRTTAIGPYLALVAANAVMQQYPAKALEYFDWARLVLPGTIVEEAALRRSLVITVKNDMVMKSKVFFRRYFQRFPLSPYSSQVADLFVEYLATNFGLITSGDIVELLAPLSDDRRQAVYLRIAKRAALDGQHELGQFAATHVLELQPDETSGVNRLARLYLGLSTLPAGEVQQADEILSRLSNDMLGPQERRLRNAATYVLDEILRPIPAESLTQAPVDNLHADTQAAFDRGEGMASDMPIAPPGLGGEQTAHDVPMKGLDPQVTTFIKTGRDKLANIDALLGKDGE